MVSCRHLSQQRWVAHKSSPPGGGTQRPWWVAHKSSPPSGGPQRHCLVFHHSAMRGSRNHFFFELVSNCALRVSWSSQSQSSLSQKILNASRCLAQSRDRIVALVSISKDRQHYKPGTTPDMAHRKVLPRNTWASKLLYNRERLKLLEFCCFSVVQLADRGSTH